MRSASKSTPAPTTKSSIAPIMFARSVWPALSRAATTCACEVPTGNCAARVLEAKPSKMMLVASPRILGAITARKTPTDPRIDTKMNATAWGLSSPISRPKLWPKFAAFPGATLSQSPELRRACSASSSSSRSSSVSRSGALMRPPPAATRRSLCRFRWYPRVPHACRRRPSARPRAPRSDPRR